MLTITLSTTDLYHIKQRAKLTAWGGQSAIRQDNRQETLHTDQLIGQCGEYAGCMYLTGGNHRYYMSQLMSERLHKFDAKLGDGGEDILGLNLDFKTSRQGEKTDILNHKLAVRPNEFKQGWVYMLMLVLRNDELIGFNFDKNIDVCIAGWASSDMFPKHTAKQGIFEGAYCLPVKKLIAPMPIKWFWRRYR